MWQGNFSFCEFIQPAITMQGPMLYQALVEKIYDEWINFSSTSLNQNASACAIYPCACLQAISSLFGIKIFISSIIIMTIVYSKLFSQVSKNFNSRKSLEFEYTCIVMVYTTFTEMYRFEWIACFQSFSTFALSQLAC